MSKVSIIVPVYNVERYVEKCINSLINQTFKDIEIILIDDGSTDNSLKICQKFAENDDRIIVKCNDKQGVSEARNTGVRESSGKYIIFVDSDDWLELDMVEKMYEIAEKSDSEIILCSAYINKKNDESVSGCYYKDYVFKGEDKVILQMQANGISYKNKCANQFSCGVPWAKIYKSSFVKEKNLLFEKELPKMEDMIFNLYAFEYANSIKYVSIPLYHYRKRNSSVCNVYDEEVLKKHENVLNALKKYIDNTTLGSKEKLMDVYNRRVFRALDEYIYHLCRKRNPRFSVKEIKNKINEFLEKYIENIKNTKEKYLTSKEKIKKKLILKNRLTLLILIKRIAGIKNIFKRSKNFD